MSEKRTISKVLSALLGRGLLVAVVGCLFVLTPSPAMAWPCDFLTGGGWIVHYGAHANFGVGGGCKFGSPTWGHLEYIDHGMGLNVHWTSITGYFEYMGDTGTDPKTGQPTGARDICGTARTNLYGDVHFRVNVKDAGEPGINDHFDIRLWKCDAVTGVCTDVYDTTQECYPHYLGSSAPCAPGDGGGGNIQLHKPNPSTTGNFGGSCYPEF